MNWLVYGAVCPHKCLSRILFCSWVKQRSAIKAQSSRPPVKITCRDGETLWLRKVISKANLINSSTEFLTFWVLLQMFSLDFCKKSKLCNIRCRALDEHLKDPCLFLSLLLGTCRKSFSFSPLTFYLSCPFFLQTSKGSGVLSCAYEHPSLQ